MPDLFKTDESNQLLLTDHSKMHSVICPDKLRKTVLKKNLNNYLVQNMNVC